MTNDALTALNADATTTKRAQYEAFEFTVDGPDVHVRNGSYGADADDHEYTVHVESGIPSDCTCPAFEHRDGACKHMVAVAIREPVLEAATDPDVATDGGERTSGSRSSSGLRSDGGELVVASDTTGVDDTDERPEDCDCLPTFDDLPCWPCYRDGFRSPNPDTEEAER